jgi:hypothetical protein
VYALAVSLVTLVKVFIDAEVRLEENPSPPSASFFRGRDQIPDVSITIHYIRGFV